MKFLIVMVLLNRSLINWWKLLNSLVQDYNNNENHQKKILVSMKWVISIFFDKRWTFSSSSIGIGNSTVFSQFSSDDRYSCSTYVLPTITTNGCSSNQEFFLLLYVNIDVVWSVQLVVSPNENEDRPVHESDALLPVQIHGEISATYHRLPLRTVKQVFVEVLTNQEMTKKNKSKVTSLDQVTSFYGLW